MEPEALVGRHLGVLKVQEEHPRANGALLEGLDGDLVGRAHPRACTRDGSDHASSNPRLPGSDAGELLARLCALVPPPGFQMIRYFGVIASRSVLGDVTLERLGRHVAEHEVDRGHQRGGARILLRGGPVAPGACSSSASAVNSNLTRLTRKSGAEHPSTQGPLAGPVKERLRHGKIPHRATPILGQMSCMTQFGQSGFLAVHT
ncbi:transposase [Nannocystis pusilla]|uniref:transposase n=1 Tax=Nannocystis pusilla TaxID=889268 RepID=UPI003B83A559